MIVNKIVKRAIVIVGLLCAGWAMPAWSVDAPTISGVQINNSQVTIEYSSSQALTGVNVYRSGRYVTTIKPAPQRGNVTLTGSAGSYCIVAIAAVAGGEQFSACSAAVNSNNGSNAPPSSVGAPTNFRAAVYSGSAAELFWSPPADGTLVNSYRLFRDGRLEYAGNGRSHFEGSLVDGRVYRYSLITIDTSGRQSDEVDLVLVAGQGNNPSVGQPQNDAGSIAMPANFRGDVYSSTAAELFWDAVQGSGIQYELRRDGVLLATTGGRSYFEGALQPGQSYQYELRAVNNAGAASQNASFTLRVQGASGPVGNNPGNANSGDTDFDITLSPDRFTIEEGAGVVVPIQIQRRNNNQAPINLSLRPERGDFSRFMRHGFDHNTIQGEASTSLRMWLSIAAMPIQNQERRYILRAEQQGRSIERTLYLDFRPVNAPDVYLLIGQSNMEGASERYIKNSNPGGPDERNPRIRQLNVRQNSTEAFSQDWQFSDEQSNVSYPTFIEAEDPLHEPRAPWQSNKSAQFIGPGLSFAKAALADTTRQIYLVPSAWSASGFCRSGVGDVGWNAYPTQSPNHVGTQLADRALTRLNMTLRDTGGIFRGILWHQGEADSNNPDCAYRYQDNLRSLVERIRSEARGDRRGGVARGANSDVPFVVGTMSRGQDNRGDFSQFGELKTVVDTVHRNVAINIPNATFVNNDDLRPPTYHCGDNSCVHFGGAAYREMGYRFYLALRDVWARDGNN